MIVWSLELVVDFQARLIYLVDVSGVFDGIDQGSSVGQVQSFAVTISHLAIQG